MRHLKKYFHGNSLKTKILRSSSITILSYGFEQLLRLLSNLILTRLLFPEAFGIMSLATVILIGLNMLSDIGVEQSVIQNNKGTEPSFRNTAWAAQIIRGFILWAVACIVAYPISLIYEEPILFPLISALGVTLAVKGFTTTSLAINNRELKLFRLSVVKVGTQCLGIFLTVVFAMYFQSVWALALGNITASIIGVTAGNLFLNDNHTHKFQIDKKILLEIISFGKWIFLSSMLGFLANQADKMIIGKFMTMSDLGIYVVAITLAQIPRSILYSLNRMVLFPVYSLIKDEDLATIQHKVKNSRLLITSILLPISIFFILSGGVIIETLYDSRYHDAGWMVQVLAAGIAFQIATNAGPFYLGFGRSGLFAFTIAIKASTLILSMLVGGYLFGTDGLIIGISLSYLLNYFVEIYFLIQFKLWFWKLDLLFITIISTISALSYRMALV